jgi:hypothetical protein
MRSLCIAALCLVALAVPASSLANDQDDNACDMIKTSAAFKAILGGSSLEFARNLTAHSSKQNSSGVLHSVCNGYIWRGARPASRQEALAALHSGSTEEEWQNYPAYRTPRSFRRTPSRPRSTATARGAF